MSLMGAPFSLSDPVEVAEKADEYFQSLIITEWREVYDPDENDGDGGKVWRECVADVKMPGIAGLSYALGISRRSFQNWVRRAGETDEDGIETTNSQIAHVLIRAKNRIEAHQEAGLFDKEMHRGSAFSLAVNYRWRDTERDAVVSPGEGFAMNVISPELNDERRVAIPKWEPKGED